MGNLWGMRSVITSANLIVGSDGSKSDQIADAICELLANPERAKQMGSDGREWVIKNWQLSNWSAKFNKVLINN